VKRLEELLRAGVDVDQREEDTGNTALMFACQCGQRQAMFYLVDKVRVVGWCLFVSLMLCVLKRVRALMRRMFTGPQHCTS
jgi:ankyrin repeat protein